MAGNPNMSDTQLKLLMSLAGDKLKMSPDQLQVLLQKGDIQGISGRSGVDINSILNDPKAIEQILNSPKAKSMLKDLKGGR